jgi:hypothetical protein
MFATYNPKLVRAVWGPVVFEAFADGTFIDVERTSDTFTRTSGAHGDGTRVQSPDMGGTFTINLQWSSPSNPILSSIHFQDELFGNQVFPFLVRDLNGNSILEGELTWIKKPANGTFDLDGPTREWMFDSHEIILFHGQPSSLL